MQLIESVGSEGWEDHNQADGKRHDESILRSIKIIDSELGELYFYTFLSTAGIRHLLSKYSSSFKNGVAVITGYDDVEHEGFKMLGAFTPEEHRGNKYCKRLLESVVTHCRKVVGDTQNTRDGQNLIHYVGMNNRFRYRPALVIEKENYLLQMESDSVSEVEKERLKRIALHVAILEVKR